MDETLGINNIKNYEKYNIITNNYFYLIMY